MKIRSQDLTVESGPQTGLSLSFSSPRSLFNFSSPAILSTSHPPLTIPLSFPSPSHFLLYFLSFNTTKPVTMGPRRELQINFPAPPAIEWCLCVGVMHHSRPPLLRCPTQPLYRELSRRPALSNLSLPPLSSDTADTFN